METVLIRGGLLAFSGDDSFSIRAIPHKERTAKRSEKRYNKEVKNVHDSNMVVELLQGTEEDVYGDSGYLGAEKKDDGILVNNERKPIRYQINKRPSQLKKASGERFELLKAIEHAKSSVRSKVEHVFCVIKRIFHFCKTRYRGREKLHQHCCTLFALANLYLARNRMKVA